MTGKRCCGDQDMSDVGGQLPGASVVSPASCPALHTNTAVDKGPDKFTSSSQAADDMAPPNQPTDNTTVSDSLMDVAPLLHESTDVTTAEHQMNYVTPAEPQLTDVEMITDSRSDKASGECTYRDFSLLPLIVWLKIFLCLNQRDRLALSVTCRSLYEVCRDSSVLWRSVFVDMEIDDVDQEVVRMKATDRSVLCAHYHQIQKLVIQMRCCVSFLLETSSFRVLSEAAKGNQLKHLEIINIIGGKPVNHDLKSERTRYYLRTFITSPNTSQLCRLKIQGFDWGTQYRTPHDFRSGLVETLENSSFTSSLTHLYLGLIFFNSGEICHTIERFQNLQHLTVPFKCLSDCLLDTFSEQLKEVHFVVYRNDYPNKVTNWPQVLTRLPQLSVGLIFVGNPTYVCVKAISSIQSYLPISFIRCEDMYGLCNCIPFEFLENVLTSCARLKVLQCRYHELLGTKDFQCNHIHNTNRPYGRLEEMVIKIVSQIHNLDYLEFSGNITNESVLALAATRRWRVLEFYAESITFQDSHDREKKLQTLCKEMSRILGRDWQLRSHDDPVTH